MAKTESITESVSFRTEEAVREGMESVEKIERLSLRWNRRKDTSDPLYSPEAMLANPETTVCFVSADIGMGSDLLNMRVVKRLEELLPKQKNSGKPLCHLENLSIR